MTFIPGIGESGPLTGPRVLGYMLSCILFGILTIQVYNYNNIFPNDKMWIKWLVGVLFLLEIIATICAFIDAWAAFGTGWGDIHSLLFYDWSLLLISLLNSAIASVVQFFFSVRIFKLTNSIWLLVIICAISSLQCVMVFYGAITNAVRGRSFEGYYQLYKFASIPLVADAVCDILIATCTVIILVKRVRRSHFRKTNTTIKRLIMLSVEIGLLTASCAVVELIFWQAEKFMSYHYLLNFVLGKLYSNAMMAALNSRAHPENYRNTLTTIDMTTHNHLILFQDEYPESSPDLTAQSTSIGIIRKVDAPAFMPSKGDHDEVHRTNSGAPDTNV